MSEFNFREQQCHFENEAELLFLWGELTVNHPFAGKRGVDRGVICRGRH